MDGWVVVVISSVGTVGTGIGCWLGGMYLERARHARARAAVEQRLPPRPRDDENDDVTPVLGHVPLTEEQRRALIDDAMGGER